MIKMLKDRQARRWGGLRFYNYATTPPDEAPVGFRPQDV